MHDVTSESARPTGESFTFSCAASLARRSSLCTLPIFHMEAGAPTGMSASQKASRPCKAKGNREWAQIVRSTSVKVAGPLVAGYNFSVAFKLDVTFKPEAKRCAMEEIAMYKVADGKIDYEEFFYNM